MKTRKPFLLAIIILTGFAITAIYSCSDDDNDIINDKLPVLTTTEVTDVTAKAAKSGGSISFDGEGYTITSRGVVWGREENPTTENNSGKTIDGDGTDMFISTLRDLEKETQYYVRAYATNINGTGYGNNVSFSTGKGVADIDGNIYKTVIIGDQEWMAENLRVTRYNNSEEILTGLSNADWSYNTNSAYAIYPHTGGEWPDGPVEGINSDAEMVDAYGKLYNWYAATDLRGLCPAGWSLPSHGDWTQLEQYICNALGNSDCETHFPYNNTLFGWRGTNEGNALKSCRQVNSPLGGECNINEHPRWSSDNTYHGFDEFGFSVLPGGARGNHGIFGYVGYWGNWWSATEDSDTSAWLRIISSGNGNVARDYYFKGGAFSVRCSRDL